MMAIDAQHIAVAPKAITATRYPFFTIEIRVRTVLERVYHRTLITLIRVLEPNPREGSQLNVEEVSKKFYE